MAELLNLKAAAGRLGIAPITVRRLLKGGRMPHHKIGKHYWFTETDLSTFIERTAVPAK